MTEEEKKLFEERQSRARVVERLKIGIHNAHERLKKEVLLDVDPLVISKRITIDVTGDGVSVAVSKLPE